MLTQLEYSTGYRLCLETNGEVDNSQTQFGVREIHIQLPEKYRH